MTLDPTGRMVTLIRDYPAVAAITTRVRGGEKAPGDAAPFVVVRRLTSVPWIGDPGTENAGVMTVRYVALCYAAKVSSGEQLAFGLAGAVNDAITDRAPFLYTATGGSGVVYSIQEDSIGSALRDPVTGEPYVPLQFTVSATAQVAAA